MPQARQLGELTDSTEGPVTEVRRVDLELLDQQVPGELAPVYVDLIGSVPNVTADDPVPVPPPALDEGPHLSYAVQWFIFAAAVVLGWILAVRRSIASHRKAVAAEARRRIDRAHGRSRRTSGSGFPTISRRRIDHDDDLNSSVITRATSVGSASMWR